MADDASSITAHTAHPTEGEAARLERGLERLQILHDEMAMRHALLSTGLDRLEGLRQTMIAQLDAITPDADLEPSLGFPQAQLLNWTPNHSPDQRTPWPNDPGSTDDREEEADHEPSLGSVGAQSILFDQARWAEGPDTDLEDEHDGREPDVDDEPSLGSMDGARYNVVVARDADGRALKTRLTDPADQARWATGGTEDVEEQCEDEGAACEDEGAWDDLEPDDWGWEAPDHGTSCPSAVGVWPPLAKPR